MWIAFIFQYLWDTKQLSNGLTPTALKLWIAFIFQYLWDTKQPKLTPIADWNCCELLSFFSIFGIQNNSLYSNMKSITVVNCFHFSVSLGYKTTWTSHISSHSQLWIAFIFQYLWDTKQLRFLSYYDDIVVNCFHFSVSLGYKTTFRPVQVLSSWLWIAFIFQYLWDTKQQDGGCVEFCNSCELLSFFSIFGIQNNPRQ